MRVLDKWNVEKTNRFEPANEPVEAGFSFLIRAYRDVIKWKKRYEKALFYTQKNYKLRP